MTSNADPKRPWKAIIAAVVAALAVIVAQGTDLPDWLVLVAGALVAGLSTFLVKNPAVGD